MKYIDFKTTTTNGVLDISLNEEYNNRSLIMNALLKKGRLFFDNNTAHLSEKGGCVGDSLFEREKQTGSRIWYLLRRHSTNDIVKNIRPEIERILVGLQKEKIINSFAINSIVVNGDSLLINLLCDNQVYQLNL
jgi:phage gp46-like protein